MGGDMYIKFEVKHLHKRELTEHRADTILSTERERQMDRQMDKVKIIHHFQLCWAVGIIKCHIWISCHISYSVLCFFNYMYTCEYISKYIYRHIYSHLKMIALQCCFHMNITLDMQFTIIYNFSACTMTQTGTDTNSLTHWGRVTHICIRKVDHHCLAPTRHQTITRTNTGILLIGLLGTNFMEILIKIHTFSFKEMHLNIVPVKWQQPFCLSLNALSAGF